MPTLPTRSFSTIVQNTVAGIQGRSSKLLNFAVGSTLRAIVEGFAGVFLWFEALVLKLLTAIRLSTSSDIDVDTFTADFMPVLAGSQTSLIPAGSPRLGAQAASGEVTFSRQTAGATSCFIPAALSVAADGTITPAGSNTPTTVKTADGSQQFVVIGDATFSTYSNSLGGYTLAPSIASIDVPIKALVPGSAGNVANGSITTIFGSAPQGIDNVVNAADFVNGDDQESDSALKSRFSAYILGLSRGDIYGLTASIEGTAINVQWTLTESYNLDGTWRPGFFFIIADDGSGAPSDDFLLAVTNAANAVRPLTIQFSVFPPSVVNVTVTLTIATLPGYDHNTVLAAVAATITDNINGLGLGNALPFSIISSWAYSVKGVKTVSNVLLNGSSGDGASIAATRSTVDTLSTIADKTIKCTSCIVS